MADLFTFAKSYFDDMKEEMYELIPGLRVHLKTVLQLRGKKIQYDDFSKFVKDGDAYVPVVCVPSVDEYDDVLDLSSLLNVGAAEMLMLLSDRADFVDTRFVDWCYANYKSAIDDWNAVYDAVYAWKSKSYHDDIRFAFGDSLRGSIIDYRFPTVRRIYNLLSALKIVSPKFYCVAIIELLKLSVYAIPLFVDMGADVAEYVADQDVFRKDIGREKKEGVRWQTILSTKMMKFGAIEYTTDDNKIRKITDCRGAALCLFELFAIQVFRKYGDSVGNIIKERKLQDKLESIFLSCLGDDFVGRILRNGRGRIHPCDKIFVEYCEEARLLPVDCHVESELNGMTVGRGMQEAHVLWKHATGVQSMECTGFIPPVDCTYGSPGEIELVCKELIFGGFESTLATKLKAEREAAIKSIDIDKMMAPYRKKADEEALAIKSEAVREAESLRRKNTELKKQLELVTQTVAEKQHLIEQLRADKADLESKMKSFFSDDDYTVEEESGEADTGVSVQDMLDYVNQFRLVVIGGFDTLQSRLESLGLTNVFFISSAHAMNGTVATGDFFCVCTKFTSHKLVRGVERQYANQLEQFFHFNGTNAEALLRAYYTFAKNWLEDSP